MAFLNTQFYMNSITQDAINELINIKECNRNLPLLFSKVITINKYELLINDDEI